ncbi:MAG: hydrogenase formation protein HypD [Clostridia bacterium]|nr:hydrogenase formation protein HypD [Clostridia bacterium]
MDKIKEIAYFLKTYDGEPITLMEVCGTHTASIVENGIESMLSDKIRLITGPGCPVCVTVAAYIDKLCELAKLPNTCVCSFGDMIRVKGSRGSLHDAKAEGGRTLMVYSPLDLIEIAKGEPRTTFIFAAVGFETTTPLYAVLLEEIIKHKIKNIKLLCALKTMPTVIDKVLSADNKITGMIAPGHVSVITGSDIFKPFAEKYKIPFVVAGFEGEQLLLAIWALTKLKGKGEVKSLYTEAVTKSGNEASYALVEKYFEPCAAAWRGLGIIENSGMKLRAEYAEFDVGSECLYDDFIPKGCSCGEIITGLKKPEECPLFGKVCTPLNPVGACMVSHEGSCFNYFMKKG